MFHLLGYHVLLGTTADTVVPAINDGIFTLQNNGFQPQRNVEALFAYAGSATLDRAKIVSPSNRQITTPYIRPIQESLNPGDDPNVADFSKNPFTLRGLEVVTIEATSDIAMGTEDCFAFIGVQDQHTPAPQGNIFTLRGTSTTATTADVWSNIGEITWEDTLPEGEFAIVGLEVDSANAIAARIIVQNQRYRPGSLSITDSAERGHDMFRKGRLGLWGRFRQTAMPEIEVITEASDNSHVIYMDIIRTSPV